MESVTIGNATLWHADCLEALLQVKADAVVSDPPFSFAGGLSNGRKSITDDQFFTHWLADVFRRLELVTSPTHPWFLWSDWRSIPAYDKALNQAGGDDYTFRWVSQVLIHDREMVGMGSPFRNQTDWVAVIRGGKTDFAERIAKNQPNVIRGYWYYGKHENHPAEKCPDFSRKLVEWATDPCQIVLDPFMGSGTTGVAAVSAGRRFIGIEKERPYFDIACQRIDAAQKEQMPLALGC